MWGFGVFRIGSRKAVYSDYILSSVCFYSADNFKNKGISAQASIYKDRNSKNAGKRTQILEKEKKKTLAWFVFPLYIMLRIVAVRNKVMEYRPIPTLLWNSKREKAPKKIGVGRKNFVSFFVCKLYDFYRRICLPDFQNMFFPILDNLL